MKDEPVLYRIIRYPVIWILRGIYRAKIVGKQNIPKNGPVILACTHKNNFDPGLMLAATRRTVLFMTKDKLHKGFFAPFFRSIGTIPVNRSIKDINAKNIAIEILKKGKVLGIFPEGTHNKTKDLIMPFKFGAVSFAKKTEALIVPCAIVGEYKMFRKGLMIIIGTPFSVADMELEEANKLLETKVIELIKSTQKDKPRTTYLC